MLYRFRLVLLFATIQLLACGGGGGGGGGPEASSPTEQVTVVFENPQFEDATVYVQGASGTRRLGRVSGASTERFQVPHTPTGFVIRASFTGLGDFETDHIRTDPGDVVTVVAQSTGNLVYSISR